LPGECALGGRAEGSVTIGEQHAEIRHSQNTTRLYTDSKAR
jgi:hypothetical protein